MILTIALGILLAEIIKSAFSIVLAFLVVLFK